MKAIFVTARVGSRRLPRKMLLKIGGRAVIEHVMDRMKRSKEADMIILCTTTLPEDTTLKFLAMKNGIRCFRGSAEDKMERWLGAADAFGIDRFVTADGDDLFCEPELIDMAFRQMDRSGADFIESDNTPCGAFTYAIRTEALRKACEMKDTDSTEMMSVYFTDTGMFHVEWLESVPGALQRPEIRMTLDYPEDLDFFRTVFAHFGHKTFNLWDVIEYLDEYPEVARINAHCHQKFIDNQKAKTRMVLKSAYC